MSNKVVWFEVVGQDADKMRSFYGSLFGWNFNVMPEIDYGLTACDETGKVRHIYEEEGTHFISDFPECLEVDLARVSGAASNN